MWAGEFLFDLSQSCFAHETIDGGSHIGFRLISASGKFLKLERKTVDSAKALRFPASLSIKSPVYESEGIRLLQYPQQRLRTIKPRYASCIENCKSDEKACLNNGSSEELCDYDSKGVPKSMQRGG